MADQSLLEQAQAIQAQKLGQIPSGGSDLLNQAKQIQQQKLVSSQPPPEPSIGQTVQDQGLQGATAGFSDELAGAGQAGLQAISGLTGYSPGPKQGHDYESIKAAYLQMRDQQRKQLEAEQEAHPLVSLGAQVAGGVPAAIASGGAGLAGAAGLGAAGGLGTSKADIAQNGISALPEAAADTTIGATVGTVAGGLGGLLGRASNPEVLENAASKNAIKAVGMNPRADIPVNYDSDTGRLIKLYNDTKGIGNTAIKNGALPMTGGMEGAASGAQDAITQKFQELQPIIQQTQDKLTPQMDQSIDQVGNLGDKLANYTYQFFKDIPQTSMKSNIVDKIGDAQLSRIGELANADGDLPQLMDLKKQIYSDAVSLNKNLYKSTDPELKETEATYLKGLANIVKTHTEDLAGTVDPNAAGQIKDLNQQISQLIPFQGAAEKQIGKTGVAGSLDPSKLLTGYSSGQLAQVGIARGQSAAAKVLSTPAGKLVQAVASKPVVQSAVESPWSQEIPQGIIRSSFDQNPNSNEPYDATTEKKATQLSSNLYNATNESLQQVSQTLSKDRSLKYYGDALNKAIADKDNGAKNRAIFLILQNSQARKMVSPEGAE